MRLWRKRDSVEGLESEAAGAAPAHQAGAVDEVAPPGETPPPGEADLPEHAGAVGETAAPGQVAPPGEADPAREPVPADEPAADDLALPGTAGYRHRKAGDTMPARFTFVRPDGQPEPKKRRGFFRG